jgi:hypothetical protein
MIMMLEKRPLEGNPMKKIFFIKFFLSVFIFSTLLASLIPVKNLVSLVNRSIMVEVEVEKTAHDSLGDGELFTIFFAFAFLAGGFLPNLRKSFFLSKTYRSELEEKICDLKWYHSLLKIDLPPPVFTI